MKKILSLIYVWFAFITGYGYQVSAQPTAKSKNVPYITSNFPVKIDGGCSFFTDINTPLSKEKYQLVIDSRPVAFIEYKQGKFAYFKRINRVENDKGYVDYYQGKEGSFILEINNIAKINQYATIRQGMLKLTFKGLSQNLRVHGHVEEADRYTKSK